MKKRNLTTVQLFVASGAETKPLRNKVELALKELSQQHKKSNFDFQLLWWEDESAAVPLTGRSQDEYNELIDESDMVAIIIKNSIGKYTKEEFDYAVKLFKENKTSPRVVVYTLPTGADDEGRFHFVSSLRSDETDYFHCKVDNEDQLTDKIKGELLRIKNEYEEDQMLHVNDVSATVNRLALDSDITKEAIALFEEGDYQAASDALNIDEIRERAKTLSIAQKKVAEAFVLKAKLELTNIKEKNRFIFAEKIFEEALNTSREPEILFECAYYYQAQRDIKRAKLLYTEALELYRTLAEQNPVAYNPDVAMTLNNLANLHSVNNEYEKTEEEYIEALGIRRTLAEQNPVAYNPSVARTLNNLAILHRVNNEYEKAEEEYIEALGIRRTLAEQNPAAYNPDVATTLNNLANLHSDNNEYEKAEEEYTEALELYRTLAEENPAAYNPDVAMTLYNLANLHNANNEYEKAGEEYTEALELITPFYDKYPKAYQKLYDSKTKNVDA